MTAQSHKMLILHTRMYPKSRDMLKNIQNLKIVKTSHDYNTWKLEIETKSHTTRTPKRICLHIIMYSISWSK